MIDGQTSHFRIRDSEINLGSSVCDRKIVDTFVDTKSSRHLDITKSERNIQTPSFIGTFAIAKFRYVIVEFFPFSLFTLK